MSHNKGFTVLELVITLAYISLLSFAIMPLITDSYSRIPRLYTKYDAIQYARRALFYDIPYVENGTAGMPFQASTSSVGSHATSLGVAASSYMFTTDIANTAHGVGSDTCNIDPYATSSYHIVSTYALPATFSANSLDILNGYLYIAGQASDASTSDFYIFDISSTTHPVPVANARLSNTGLGFSAIHATDGFVFGAERSTRYPLRIIDVRNKSTPSFLYQYQISTSSNLTGYGYGNAVQYYDKKIFLGLTKSTSSELYVLSFDPDTPSAPQYLGEYETNTQINAILAKNSSLFVATPDQQQLRILDISNPQSIQEKSYVSPSGYAVQDGESLFLTGSTLYLGRTVGGFDSPTNHELFAYDVSDEYAPRLIFSENLAASLNDLEVDHGKGFLFVGSPHDTFSVFDFSSSSPQAISNFPLTDTAGSADCEDDTVAFVSAHGSGFTILTH